MVSPEATNWLYDYGFEDIAVPENNFAAATATATAAVAAVAGGGPGFNWPSQPLSAPSNEGVELDVSLGDSDAAKDPSSKKRMRSESCSSSSKACREKQRRDRLNDKFMELGALLEPGRPPKTDKAAILVDAVRMVTQLRSETQKLKDSNVGLQEKIKELKVEKNELRDEKQRLKGEKERLEQQLKNMSAPQPQPQPQPSFFPAYAAAQGQAPGSKMVPIISYPGVAAMWQFMPPAAVDTSHDHGLYPPVA